MKPSLYKIDTPTTGMLFQMPKPSGEWLRDDLRHFQLSGMEHIVSMLEPEEALELGLSNEQSICLDIGLDFTLISVPDREIPDLNSFKPVVAELAEKLKTGQSLGIHCRAGIGRSGLLNCCILKSLGLETGEAIRRVSEARGLMVPDTQIQIEFIEAFLI